MYAKKESVHETHYTAQHEVIQTGEMLRPGLTTRTSTLSSVRCSNARLHDLDKIPPILIFAKRGRQGIKTVSGVVDHESPVIWQLHQSQNFQIYHVQGKMIPVSLAHQVYCALPLLSV